MRWSYSQFLPVKNGGHAQKLPRMHVPPFLQQLRLCSATTKAKTPNLSAAACITKTAANSRETGSGGQQSPTLGEQTFPSGPRTHWSHLQTPAAAPSEPLVVAPVPLSLFEQVTQTRLSIWLCIPASASHQQTNTKSLNKHGKMTEEPQMRSKTSKSKCGRVSF